MSTFQPLGDGLYYGKGTPDQTPGFRFVWRVKGRGRARDTRTLSLGTENEITRSDAERLATYARELIASGIDPMHVPNAAIQHAKRHWDRHHD